MEVNGGKGFSAGWRQSPYAKVWPPALHFAVFAPQTSGSTPHTFPPHFCVENKSEGDEKTAIRSGNIYFTAMV